MTMASGTPGRLAVLRSGIGRLGVRPIALIGLGILLVVLVAAIAAPLIAPYDPDTYDALIRLSPPNPAHWFGTDQLDAIRSRGSFIRPAWHCWWVSVW